jgi:predicted kinase
MPKVYVLVGVPGAGKSTWVQNQDWALGLTIVSTDAFVEHYARAQGKTYNEVFKDYMPTAVDLMTEQVVFAREHEHTLIWDQTSTTVKSRKKKFRMLPNYEHIAVVFKTPDPLELAIRLKNRPGKNIPQHVIDSMIAGWQEPTEEEGYAEVWNAS